MPRHKRLAVLTTMIDNGLVPLFFHNDVEVATRIVQACLEGGARCIEFTNRGDLAHLVFEQLMRRLVEDPRLILGVGSVVDAGTASLYMQLGANFIVGPMLNPDVARTCNRRKVAYLPGCGSVTEISQAEELGVELCKVFPGEQVGGPEFVKAVKAPMPWTRLVPTGGVDPTEESIRQWFNAGVDAVGIGSKLIREDWITSENYLAITEQVKAVLGWIQTARRGKSPRI